MNCRNISVLANNIFNLSFVIMKISFKIDKFINIQSELIDDDN